MKMILVKYFLISCGIYYSYAHLKPRVLVKMILVKYILISCGIYYSYAHLKPRVLGRGLIRSHSNLTAYCEYHFLRKVDSWYEDDRKLQSGFDKVGAYQISIEKLNITYFNLTLSIVYNKMYDPYRHEYSCRLGKTKAYTFYRDNFLLLTRRGTVYEEEGVSFLIEVFAITVPTIKWVHNKTLVVKNVFPYEFVYYDFKESLHLFQLIVKEPNATHVGEYELTLTTKPEPPRLGYNKTVTYELTFVVIEDWREQFTYITFANYKANISSNEVFFRTCFRMPENEHFNSQNHPIKESCQAEGDCWESQLSLLNKAIITKVYNDYRLDVAKKKRIYNMFEMVWHWTLELEAKKLAANCTRDFDNQFGFNRVTIPTRDIIGLDRRLTCEIFFVNLNNKKRTRNYNQEEFIKQFDSLLKKQNIMHDLDEYGEFARPNALFFGCAMTVVNQVDYDSVVYFGCEYCTKEKTMDEKDDKCPQYSRRGDFSINRPILCRTNFVSLYACEPKNPCTKNDLISYSWNSPRVGLIEEFTVLMNSTNKLYVVYNVTHKLEDGSTGEGDGEIMIDGSATGFVLDPINRPRGWFKLYGKPPPGAYSFNRRDTRLLNETIVERSLEHIIVGRVPQESTTVAVIKPVVISYKRTICCIFVFLLQFGAAIFVTYLYVSLKRKSPLRGSSSSTTSSKKEKSVPAKAKGKTKGKAKGKGAGKSKKKKGGKKKPKGK